LRVRASLERDRRLRRLPQTKTRSGCARDGARRRLQAQRMTLPLRIRLAFVFALAMAVLLAAVGWFAYSRVGSDLAAALDQQLRGRTQDLSALVRHGGSLGSTNGRLVESGESFAQ